MIDRRGVKWSIVGFAAAGLSGLGLNLIISNREGSTVLGRFNILLAVFIIGGQLASAGVHAAVLYHTPRARSLGFSTRQVLVAALRLNLRSSAACTAVIVGGGVALMTLLENDPYRTGLLCIAPGLFLFPLNKTLLAHANGLGRIRMFAALYALRYVLLVGGVGLLSLASVRGTTLVLSVSIAEALLFVVLTGAQRSELRRGSEADHETGLRTRLFRFGVRGMPAGLLLDLNTRIDVLILGSIAGSRAVGRYSIAGIFAEGLYQLVIVTRFSIDPVVTTLFVEQRHDELRALVRRWKRLMYLVMVPLGGVTIAVYPIVAGLLFDNDVARETWPIYAVLATGVILTAGYIPFTGLLQQTGHPTAQSSLLAMIGATSVVLNLVLVPPFGAVGAACGAAAAQVALVPYLRTLARRRVGFAP